MHEQQHKLRKSGPDAQSSLSTALPTKGETHFLRSTHRVTAVLFES